MYSHYHGDVAALILLDSQEESAFATCMDWLEEMRQTVCHYLETQVLVGVGAPVRSLEHFAYLCGAGVVGPGSMRYHG